MDLPTNVLSYHDDAFYDLIREKCGSIVEEMFKVQKIRSTQSLLRIENLFDFMNYDSTDLDELKQKVGFRLRNGQYQVKPGVLDDINSLFEALKIIHQNTLKSARIDPIDDGLEIPKEVLNKYPGVMELIRFYSSQSINDADTGMSFLNLFLNNIIQNMSRSKTSYRYDENVQKFAVTLYILAGRNAYEFVRLNLPGALPNLSTIRSLIEKEQTHLSEGEFRFDALKTHFSLTNTNIAFCAEDCTGVIPKVTYDVNSNSFVGFSLPLIDGLPISEFYRTETLSQLEGWFDSIDKSPLLNLHMIQPITKTGQISTPLILSAYGTDAKYTSLDIIRRWIWIFQEFLARGIRIIGFSTDGDPKYLRAMKLVLGFFASLPNMKISERSDAFEVSLSSEWNWFFLRRRQLILCFQDPIHICTKLRNRLLSDTAELIIGNQRISLKILSDMIGSVNKLKHGLVKSNIYPRDKQNFASCEKISRDNVISTLENITDSLAIRLYLRLIRAIITAYIDKDTSIGERLYHAWFSVFICRIWWAWLLVKAEDEPDEISSWSSDSSSSSRSITQLIKRFFITKSSFQSIEINAHQLTYIILLVMEKNLPVEAVQIFLFNSQTCESTFRSSRAMTGIFSSIVNFSVAEFLRRAQKLAILTRIKSENEINTSNSTRLHFPKHHKHVTQPTPSSTSSTILSLTTEDIERIVSFAFHDALVLLREIDVFDSLKRKKIHTFRSLNNFVFKKMDVMSRTVDRSSLSNTSSDSESESDETVNVDKSFDREGDEEDSGRGNHMSIISMMSLRILFKVLE